MGNKSNEPPIKQIPAWGWVLIGILIVIGVIILAIVAFFYFESRKRKQNIRIEEK